MHSAAHDTQETLLSRQVSVFIETTEQLCLWVSNGDLSLASVVNGGFRCP